MSSRQLKKSLESTEGVAAVKVVGGREEQIRIEVDEKRLAELGIPITEVTGVIEQANLNRASGSLYDLDANYFVRILNEFRSVKEIERIIIRDQEGRKIVLGDIARVWRGTKDRDIIARLNGKESVELGVYKEGDANTVTVSGAVRAKLEALEKSKTFPGGVEYQIVFDQAKFIRQSIDNVLTAALVGGLLAMIVLFVFLRDARSTLIIGLSIPISIMATLALMYQTDITLNIMSLGGVALGVGMLVDNSIVVLESVYRHKRVGGGLANGVYQGTKEVGRAVTTSTFTTVAVFVPLVFVEGIAGQLFKDQALAITYSLLASLLVALTLIPMVLALQVNRQPIQSRDETPIPPTELSSNRVLRVFQRLSRISTRAGHAMARFIFVDLVQVVLTDLRRLLGWVGRQTLKVINPLLNLFGSGFGILNHAYPQLLTWSLNNKPVVFATVLGLLGISSVAYQQLGADLIPPLAQGEFSFEIKLPEGKPIEQTDRIINDIEMRVKAFSEIETVFSSVGGSNKNQFASRALEENVGQLYVVMKDRRDKLVEERSINKIREELRRYPEITYTFNRPTLFSFKTPIEVEIYAFDIENQRRAAELVSKRLEQIDGLSDIQSTTELGNPEIQVRFDRERLARWGLDEGQVADILRNKIRGDVASRYREGDRQIDILVRAEESERNTIADIKNLVINEPGNTNALQQREGPGSRTSPQDSASRTPGRRDEQTRDGRRQPNDRPQEQRLGIRRVPIQLGAVANVALTAGPSEIRRIRSQRAAVVSANLVGRDLSSVSREIRAELQQLRSVIPVNTVIGLGGQNEEMENSYRTLLFALGLAVFLVYLVMASQFESLVHPFIILFTVPLAIVGVLLSLFVTMTTLNVMVFLGVIVLAGIVVNNAIVLIDYTNQLRQRGLSKREALLEAGQLRLRPIMMTTLTTVLGLLPMALSWGEGAEVRAPMAITVMGGLLFSTMLTLLLIPVVYELVDRKVYIGADFTLIDPVPEPEREIGEL